MHLFYCLKRHHVRIEKLLDLESLWVKKYNLIDEGCEFNNIYQLLIIYLNQLFASRAMSDIEFLAF